MREREGATLRRTEDVKGIHPVPRGLRLAALQMMYKHIDAFLYLGAHEFRNSGRGTFCWEVDPVWVASEHGDKFGYCRENAHYRCASALSDEPNATVPRRASQPFQ